MATRSVRPTPSACAACTAHPTPRQPNAVTASLAIGAVRSEPAALAIAWQRYGHLLRRVHLPTVEDILAGTGPGSQLWRLLASIGVHHSPDCPCLSTAAQMNDWTPAGCRAHCAEIVASLESQRHRYGWSGTLKAALQSVRTGLAFRLSPLDPLGSLVDEAIRLAEEASHGDPFRHSPPDRSGIPLR